MKTRRRKLNFEANVDSREPVFPFFAAVSWLMQITFVVAARFKLAGRLRQSMFFFCSLLQHVEENKDPTTGDDDIERWCIEKGGEEKKQLAEPGERTVKQVFSLDDDDAGFARGAKEEEPEKFRYFPLHESKTYPNGTAVWPGGAWMIASYRGHRKGRRQVGIILDALAYRRRKQKGRVSLSLALNPSMLLSTWFWAGMCVLCSMFLFPNVCHQSRSTTCVTRFQVRFRILVLVRG